MGAFAVYRWRDSKVRCGKFCDAFAEVYGALSARTDVPNPIATGKLVASSINKHETAIAEFNRGLSNKLRAAFQRDCDHYRKCRQRYQDFVARTGPSDDLHAASEFRQSIETLLAYAGKP